MMTNQGGRQMDRQTKSSRQNIYEYVCQHECKLGTSPHQPARVCYVQWDVNFACASILSTREALTFDRLHAPPSHPATTHTTPHLTSLYPGQLSAGTWPKKKTHLSPSFKGQS